MSRVVFFTVFILSCAMIGWTWVVLPIPTVVSRRHRLAALGESVAGWLKPSLRLGLDCLSYVNISYPYKILADCRSVNYLHPVPQTVQSLVEDWERLVPNTDTAALRTGQLLLVSGRALEKTLDDAATAAGFASRGDYEVLALMARREPERLSPVAVAELLGVSPSGMTGKLDRLERDQLLERVRDQVDRRSVKLAITAKGKELVSLGFQAAMGVYTALLSDSEAISQLADTLQEVYENLQLAGPRR